MLSNRTLENLEKEQRLVSVLGSAHALRVLAKDGKAVPSHIENVISMLLRARSPGELSSYLSYQITRLRNSKESTTDYEEMFKMLKTLNDLLDLSKREERQWKDLLMRALLNFKWVCSKVKVNSQCANGCAKKALEILQKFESGKPSDEMVNELDKEITEALACIIEECLKSGGSHGRH